MTTVPISTDSAQTNASQLPADTGHAPAGGAPFLLPVAERISDRVADEAPAQIARTQIANLMNDSLVETFRRPELPPLTPGARRVLAEIPEMKVGQDENYVAFLDLIASHIWEAGDATAVLAEVQAIIEKARAPKDPCATHTWCVETGDHFEHYSAYIQAPSPDAYGNPVLAVGLIDFTGTTTVGLLDLDLTPAEARVRIAELRAHLDNVEALVATAETTAAAG
ncbi:hypothetical protein [Streptomyces sp. NPDC059979]|uniref:hypothetical protein n=1 Tax=Streptomyces sp. NPDC059979 TaxID=3347021 RepID=UPI0036BB9B93